MKYLLLSLTLSLIVTSCNVHDSKLSAQQLNDSALTITKQYTDSSKFKDAIILLTQAIKQDSTHFEYYKNKFFFEVSIKDCKSALITLNRLLQFKPDSADLHFHAGLLQESQNDSIGAIKSFTKATQLYKINLDTMSRTSPYYFYDWRLWAASMIMIGQGDVIHNFLKENCKNSMDTSIFQPEVLSKTKYELLQIMKRNYCR